MSPIQLQVNTQKKKTTKNFLLSTILLTTILSFINSSLVVNDQSFANILNLKFEESADNLNPSTARWYIIGPDNMLNFDGRVLESHYHGSGFINNSESENFLQNFLGNGNVVAYYLDKPPQITFSVVFDPSSNSDISTLESFVDDKCSENDSFLENLNQFPFYKLSKPEHPNTNVAYALQQQVFRVFEEDPENTLKKMTLPVNLEKFAGSILLMIADAIILQDTSVLLSVESYQEREGEIDDEVRGSVLEKLKRILDKDQTSMNFKRLYNNLGYFIQKLIRFEFFYSGSFLKDLFFFYEEGNTIVNLISNMKKEEIISKVFDSERIKNLKPEHPFDGDKRLPTEYIDQKTNELIKAFEKVFNMVKDIVAETVETDPLDFPGISDPEHLQRLFQVLFEDDNCGLEYYNMYLTNFESALEKVDSLKEIGINDLNNGDDVYDLRQRLVILGDVEFDSNFDTQEYVNFEMFKESDRRLLLV